MFIKDNQGGKETTVLEYLGLYGTPLDSTNMKDFKRVSLCVLVVCALTFTNEHKHSRIFNTVQQLLRG